MYGLFLSALLLTSCGSGHSSAVDTIAANTDDIDINSTTIPVFVADSAYNNVRQQVDFGPRVPGTPAHKAAGEWLISRLKSTGANVIEQRATLTAFNGAKLPAINILGRFNENVKERILLLAHWDTRPWADQDPDPNNRTTPSDGANDGASGVGVLLEIARILSETPTDKGVDILFVDAEDYGRDNDDESWALGARYFVNNPPVKNYFPTEVILLDMVGGENAQFRREIFSQRSAPQLCDRIWQTAAEEGFQNYFINQTGGAITDDHVEFINAGIPAIDIIEFNPYNGGFNATWHTKADNMSNISAETLRAVGQTIVNYLYLKKS